MVKLKSLIIGWRRSLSDECVWENNGYPMVEVEKLSDVPSGQMTQHPLSSSRLDIWRVSPSCSVTNRQTSSVGVSEVTGSSSSPVFPRECPCTSCCRPVYTVSNRSLNLCSSCIIEDFFVL